MNNKNQYTGHRKRLRTKFKKSGIEGLHDYEQLELLLTYSVPIKDVKPVSKLLINKFKNISGVMDATEEELIKVKGIGDTSIVLIKLIRSLLTKYSEERMFSADAINSPERVYEFSKFKLGSKSNESLMAIFLNTKNMVINYEIISEGSIDSVAVYPRRIIEQALKYNASGIILVHNHPSGDTEPSTSDRELTSELKNISESMDIRLLDHVIVSKKGYYSFSQKGELN